MQTTKAKQTHHSFESSHGFYSSSSEMADFIGMESCVDLRQGEDVMINTGMTANSGGGKRDRRWETKRVKKEFPPPMPLQAWGMKRYYTSDGRLIIKEERANHEYFRAHRSNGRLTLQLVEYQEEEGEEEEVLTHPLQEEVDNEEKNGDGGGGGGGGEIDGGDEIYGGTRTEEEEIVDDYDDDGKVAWHKYDNVRMSPCMYGMPVPAIRPVHI